MSKPKIKYQEIQFVILAARQEVPIDAETDKLYSRCTGIHVNVTDDKAGKKFILSQRQQGEELKVEDHPEVGQAQTLRQAMNPSGVSWLFNVDGTSTDAIFTIARQISDLNAVQLAYKDLYKGDSLLKDLEGELSPEDYQKFLGLATKGKTGNTKFAPTRPDVPAKAWILTKSLTHARSSPVKQAYYLPGNNVLKTFRPGVLIGATTGKVVYDEDHDAIFIEAWALTSKKQKKFFWVAKSQVEIISKAEKEKREKQEGKFSFLPLEGIAGLGRSEQVSEQVISIKPAIIYNLNFQRAGNAPKHIILGTPIMLLDTGSAVWLQFENVQGLKRWVKQSEVRTIQR